MQIGQQSSHSFQLTPSSVNGKQALLVGEKGGYLVKLDHEAYEWTLVDRVEKDIPFGALKDHYGIWHDREIKKGLPLFKKVVRPVDGVIQNDEVRELQYEYPSTRRIYDKQKEPPFTGDKISIPVKHYYEEKPEAHITLKTTPQGTITVLEENWLCTGDGYSI